LPQAHGSDDTYNRQKSLLNKTTKQQALVEFCPAKLRGKAAGFARLLNRTPKFTHFYHFFSFLGKSAPNGGNFNPDAGTSGARLDNRTPCSGNYAPYSGNYALYSGEYTSYSGNYALYSGEYASYSGNYVLYSGNYASYSGNRTPYSGEYAPYSGKYTAHSGGYGPPARPTGGTICP
jgi:hypothetical protein